MQTYELLLALPGTLDEPQAQTRLQELVQLVAEHGIEARVNTLGKNRLAYPIKQIRYGYFYTIVFKAEPVAEKALQEKLALMRDVLRASVSYFNVDLTANQKRAYGMSPSFTVSAEERLAERSSARPAERRVEKSLPEKVSALVAEETPAAPVKSAAERKLDDLDMAAITKKLDDLMEGDVIPGV